MLSATLAPGLPPEVSRLTVDTIYVWFMFLVTLSGTWLLVKKRVGPFFRQMRNFLSDWAGEPERPGIKRKPGVMERLSAVEYQFTPNGGNSFHDKLERVMVESKQQSASIDMLTKNVSLLLTYLGSKDETLRELVRKQDEIGIH